MDVLVVARARSVRSLLRRAVSRPDVGLHCLADYGKLPEEACGRFPEQPDFVIVDPEGFAPSKLGSFLNIRRSQKCRLLLLLKEGDIESAEVPEGSLCLSKPGVASQWEKLFEDLPAFLLAQGREDDHQDGKGLDLLAIGASAGGPVAIVELLDALREKTGDVAIVVVQHIGLGFEEGFLSWLGEKYPGLDVGLATEGEKIRVAALRMAPPGRHLLVDSSGTFRLDTERAAVNGHRPSIDVLFQSLCRWPRMSLVAAVLLSGMGRDGASGLKELHQAGALTLAQDSQSSVVYGMPRVAMESGAAEFALNPAAIGELLRKRIEDRE